jgi:predicted acylesterase/phospholipase RssA
MRHILSVRGGGIRGILPASCLVELESQLGGLTRDHIDFCGGTSTGALIAAAVAVGLPATEILRVYTERSKEIFTPTGLLADAKRITEGFMFDPANIQKVLVSEFGASAGWQINNSPLDIMIAATAMNGHNWFFVKDKPQNAKTTGSVKLIDAAVASACAPTYFNYWTIDGIEGQTISFFDGGAGGTANPSYQTCVEAFEYDDFAPAESNVIELATGFYPQSTAPPKGLIPTIGWVTSTLVDTSEDWADGALRRQWPGLLQVINIELPSDIDEADLSSIPVLVEYGKKMADRDWKLILGTRGDAAQA